MPDQAKEGARKEPAPTESSPDGRYTRFDVVLGRGAFKTVFKAFDEREGIEVAWNQIRVLELINGSEEYLRLYQEINVLKKLKHKNIMTFYDSWIDREKQTVNFITELFTSGTLREYRKKHKKISESVLKRWAWQVLQGLVYLHGHDPPIIHRDLKCDNIFVNGSAGVVKIGDLGLATLVRHKTAPQSVLGTPEFMAPELYDEKYDEKVDVYSFGMCLLELATLEYPYSECANPAQIYKRVSQGLYPEGLKRVQDEDLRAFIQLCISHSNQTRPEARRLLKHSFFESIRAEKEATEALTRETLEAARSSAKGAAGITLEVLSPSTSRTGSESHESRHVSLNGTTSAGHVFDVHGYHGDEDGAPGGERVSRPSDGVEGRPVWGLDGEGGPRGGGVDGQPEITSVGVSAKEVDRDQGIVLLELKLEQTDGRPYTIEFEFTLDVDEMQDIMEEMQSDLHLSVSDATSIANQISCELDRVKSRIDVNLADTGVSILSSQSLATMPEDKEVQQPSPTQNAPRSPQPAPWQSQSNHGTHEQHVEAQQPISPKQNVPMLDQSRQSAFEAQASHKFSSEGFRSRSSGALNLRAQSSIPTGGLPPRYMPASQSAHDISGQKISADPRSPQANGNTGRPVAQGPEVNTNHQTAAAPTPAAVPVPATMPGPAPASPQGGGLKHNSSTNGRRGSTNRASNGVNESGDMGPRSSVNRTMSLHDVRLRFQEYADLEDKTAV